MHRTTQSEQVCVYACVNDIISDVQVFCMGVTGRTGSRPSPVSQTVREVSTTMPLFTRCQPTLTDPFHWYKDWVCLPRARSVASSHKA